MDECQSTVESAMPSKAGRNQLLMGVELPSPSYGYPTLDLLGCLACTSSIKKGTAPSAIAHCLRERARIEAGIVLDEELLIRPLKTFAASAESCSILVRQSMSSPATVSEVLESQHFLRRVQEPGRPTRQQALEAEANGFEVDTKTRADGDSTTVVKSLTFATEVVDSELNVAASQNIAVRAVVRERPGSSGDLKKEIITTLFKLRMQLVVIAPEDVAERILSYRESLKPTLRSSYARKKGSGVAQLTALSHEDIQRCPLFSKVASDDEAAWAGELVEAETKEYSRSQGLSSRCGMNPDFKNFYLRAHREALVQTLRGTQGLNNPLPSLFWSEETGVGRMPVVFLTIYLPPSVDLLLVQTQTAASGELPVLSIATAPHRHPPNSGGLFRSRSASAGSALPAMPAGPPTTIEAEMQKLTMSAPGPRGDQRPAESRRCRDCDSAFNLSAGERAWFSERGWALPVRCKQCRGNKARSSGRPS